LSRHGERLTFTDGAAVSRIDRVASDAALAGATPSRRRAMTDTILMRESLHHPAPRVRIAVVSGMYRSITLSSVPLNPRGATPMIVSS